MTLDDFKNQLPPDLRSKIGKEFKRRLPDGRVIKFVLGDITGDGVVDDVDIEILRMLCEGGETASTLFNNLTPEQLAACDVTGDGFVNREDLLALCKNIVEKQPGKGFEDKLSKLRKKVKKTD